MRRRLWWMGVVAVMLAAGGCRGDDDDADPARSTTTVVETGGCPYLTADAVAEAFGTGFEEVAGSAGTCTFRSDEGLEVDLARVERVDAEVSYPADAIERCDEGSLVEVDAGDQAFACTDVGPLAVYARDGTSITITASTRDEDPAMVEAFVALLPRVTVG
jgi:hypothetical protein